MRTNTHQFDWYSFSKLDHQNPSLSTFKELLEGAGLTTGQVQKVPVSHRRKLLLTFQKVSYQMKDRIEEASQHLPQVEFDKKMMRDQMTILKSQLDDSMRSLNANRLELQDKRNIYDKLKKKIENKKQEKDKATKKQVYYCPLCARDDIISREQFTQHMLMQHIEKIKSQREAGEEGRKQSSIPSDVRDLILSLKDKEIQIMELMLDKKRAMETQELQRNYSEGVRRMQSPKSFTDRRTEYLSAKDREVYNGHEQDQQLHGESQYLFYQKDIHEEQRQNRMQVDKIPDRLRNFDREEYYNIFPSYVATSEQEEHLPIRKSQGSDHFHQNKRINTEHYQRDHQYISQPKPAIAGSVARQQNVHRNLSWDQSIQKPQDHYRAQNYSKLYNYTQNIDTSQPHRRDKNYETVYRNKKDPSTSRITKGHIFNSGPLMDDEGGDSDYEDYFGEVEHQDPDEVEDEEIGTGSSRRAMLPQSTKYQRSPPIVPTLNMMSPKSPQINKKSALNSFSVSNANNSHMILEYSKDRSSLEMSASKDKSSSSIVSLSNSFSRRGLEISKDEDTINLSDLRFSKLEREKQLLRQQFEEHDSKELQMAPQFNPGAFTKPPIQGRKGILDEFQRQQSSNSYQNFSNNTNSFSNAEGNSRISQQYSGKLQREGGAGTKKSILDEFMMQSSHSPQN